MHRLEINPWMIVVLLQLKRHSIDSPRHIPAIMPIESRQLMPAQELYNTESGLSRREFAGKIEDGDIGSRHTRGTYPKMQNQYQNLFFF